MSKRFESKYCNWRTKKNKEFEEFEELEGI
jgi:hypothetical protein